MNRPSSKSVLTTLADCAYRFNLLCRSEHMRSEARRLVAKVQAADDEFRKGVSDWQRAKATLL